MMRNLVISSLRRRIIFLSQIILVSNIFENGYKKDIASASAISGMIGIGKTTNTLLSASSFLYKKNHQFVLFGRFAIKLKHFSEFHFQKVMLLKLLFTDKKVGTLLQAQPVKIEQAMYSSKEPMVSTISEEHYQQSKVEVQRLKELGDKISPKQVEVLQHLLSVMQAYEDKCLSELLPKVEDDISLSSCRILKELMTIQKVEISSISKAINLHEDSVVDVLNGNRLVNENEAKKLARYFNVTSTLFSPKPSAVFSI